MQNIAARPVLTFGSTANLLKILFSIYDPFVSIENEHHWNVMVHVNNYICSIKYISMSYCCITPTHSHIYCNML